MKFVHKVFILVILPIIILSATTIYFINNLLHKELQQRFVENLENSTISYATLIDAHLENISKVAGLTERNISNNFNNLNEKRFLNTLKPILSFDSLIFGTGVFFDTTINKKFGNSLNYVYLEDDKYIDISYNSKDPEYQRLINTNPIYLSAPKKQGKGVWTSPYFDFELSNRLLVTYSEPIYVDNKYIGVVTIDITLKNLSKLIEKNENIIEGNYNPFLIVINEMDSSIVYSENISMIGEYFFNYEYNSIDKKDNGTLKFDSIVDNSAGSGFINSMNGESNLIVSFADVPKTNWKIINIINTSIADNYIRDSIFWSIVIVIIVLTFLILLVYFSTNLLTKPILKLSKASVKIADGDYELKLNTNSKDEAGILARNFNKMIVEIKNREEELRDSNISLEKAQKQLLSLDDAKNEFLKMISHELRTPLNGIVGSTYFLKDMIEDPEMSEFVEMLRESVDRLDNFSKLALEITEIVAQGSSTKTETFDIGIIIKEVISGFKQDIDNKELTVKSNFAEGAIINSQPGYFKRSFEELMSNAIKYSFNKTSIDVSVSKENNNIILKVSNTGEKIDKDRIDDLTKPFGLGKEHIDKNTGLGLNFIKQYLDINNASLSINSKEEFTEIIITFKAANL